MRRQLLYMLMQFLGITFLSSLFTVFCLITMLFSPGMIANYLVVTNLLQLQDTIWALILPMAVSPFNIIVMRTFFKRSVPDSIIESARIDGASEMRIFTQIVLPLAVPGIATISLLQRLAIGMIGSMLYFIYQMIS